MYWRVRDADVLNNSDIIKENCCMGQIGIYGKNPLTAWSVKDSVAEP